MQIALARKGAQITLILKRAQVNLTRKGAQIAEPREDRTSPLVRVPYPEWRGLFRHLTETTLYSSRKFYQIKEHILIKFHIGKGFVPKVQPNLENHHQMRFSPSGPPKPVQPTELHVRYPEVMGRGNASGA